MSKHCAPAVLAALLLAACGGDERDTNASPPSIASLEQSGQLPVLDRSDSLRGPDQDQNGIRDDIDDWILRLSLASPQHEALQQLARSYQSAILVDSGNKAAVHDVTTQTYRAVACIMARSPSSGAGANFVSDLKKFSANTKPRVRAYLQYSTALDGSVGKLPDGNGCER